MRRMLGISAIGVLAFAAEAQNPDRLAQQLRSRDNQIQGVLIDAGCEDRSLWNMRRTPETQAAAVAPGGDATRGAEATQASGISVDSRTIGLERQDITPVQNPDMIARQSDPTCAIKANTRAYAVLLRDGRLLDLDEGGNTYASLAVQTSPQGKAMINGQGPGFKPRVTITGWIYRDHVFADQLKLQ